MKEVSFLKGGQVIDPHQESLITYSRPGDAWGKLGNQACGFPFEALGRIWKNSEFLYLAGRWSMENQSDTQKDICSAPSGYAARRFKYAKHQKTMRKDFESFKQDWMLWVIWQKVRGNKDFQELLLSTGDATIAEVEKKDRVWALVREADGLLRGANGMGKILMLCRDCLRKGTEPQIDYDLLNKSNIYIFGERVQFCTHPTLRQAA